MGAVPDVTAAVRVLLVDDDPLVRSGLTMMLEAFDDLDVVGAVDDGSRVMGAVARHEPDVVLMDVRMARVDGIAATAALRARDDAPEVIVLTTFDTDDHVRRALRAGASGFLLKHAAPHDIARAIRRVAAGEPIIAPQVLRRMMRHVARADVDPQRDRARDLLALLSDGERSVAELVGDGRTNAEIGAQLHLSAATVKAYMSRILRRLGCTNRVQVALLVHDARQR